MVIDIKFRAWDNKYSAMVDNNLQMMDSEGERVFDGPYVIDDNYPYWEMSELNSIHNMQQGYGDRLVFLQFTGLKDKNGVEIYEGDIFKVILPSGQVYGGAVTWNEAKFDIDNGKLTNEFLIRTASDGEVVGNIYQGILVKNE